MVSASLIGRALQFITTIAVAAWLLPSQLSLWPLFLALTQLPLVLGMMRLDIAITLSKTDDAARILCAIAVLMTVVMSAVTTAFIMLMSDLVQYYFQITANFSVAIMAFFYIIFMNLMAIYQAWLIREHRFKIISFFAIIYPALTILLCSMFYYGGVLNAITYILCNVAGYGAGIVYLLAKTPDLGLHRLISPKTSLGQMWAALKEYKSYPLLYTPYSLSQGIQERAIQLILGGVYGLAVLGQFFLVRQVLQGSAALIAQPVRQVIFAHYTSNAEKPGELLRLSKAMGMIAAITAPMALLAGREGGAWLTALLGKEWANVQDIFFWMVWVAWATVSVSWIDRLFDIAWRQKLAVGLQLISDAIILAIAAAIAYSGGMFADYVAAFAVATTSYNFLWSIAALRVAGLSFRGASLPIIMGSLGLIIALGAEFVMTKGLSLHLGLARFLGCIIALATIYILIRETKRFWMHDIKQIIIGNGIDHEQK